MNDLPQLLAGPPTLELGDAACVLRFARDAQDRATPRVTIAIPTFNRPELLRETLDSVWAQRDASYELLIVDNASAPENVAAVLALLQSSPHPVRYYVNSENVGVFRNWNRCIDLARTEWLSILNDDDLLAPLFLHTMLARIDDLPGIDAIICRPELLDQRDEAIRGDSRLAAIKAGVVGLCRFGLRDTVRLTAGRLFWSNIAGSSLGCLYRRRTIAALGGFDPAEAPIADYVLNIRLAAGGRFVQLRQRLAKVRLQVNESMKPATLQAILVRNFALRTRMVAEGMAPRGWRRWPQRLLAHELGAARAHWHQSPEQAAVGHDLKIAPPRSRARWVYFARILHGGV